MTHNHTLRPAMTALAAVIALTSAPSLAQVADDPVITTTPAIEVTPTPTVAEPVAAAPAADSTAADPLAATTTATPAARKAAPVRAAAKPRPVAARASAVAPAVAAAPAIAAPAAELPAQTPLPVESVVAPPPVVATPTAANDSAMNEMLPIAGAGGLALVLLAGTGLAIRRRRRRAQEAEAEWQDDVETAVNPVTDPPMATELELELTRPVFATPVEPAYAVAPVTAAAADAPTEVDGPVAELPDGFDLSRFGFNVQQAYKGPTEDNPSLSLKHRLRRASGMDQQERKLEAEVEAVTGESPLAELDEAVPIADAPAATQPAIATAPKGDFLFARDGTMPAFRPERTH